MKSVMSKKIEVRVSSIDKKGMFAKELIHAGEIVYIKGGHVLSRSELFSSGIINSYLPISDDYYLGAISAEEEDAIKLYNNHSCDPNCGMHGEITFVAIRDIKPGEELTVDYAFIDNEDYSFECQCGSVKCRHTVTGFDWKINRLQDEYYPYFAQYLKDKIDMVRAESEE
jgi:SET domain-containing protein